MYFLRTFIKTIFVFMLLLHAQQDSDIVDNEKGQTSQDLNLVTVHAEDAHLPSILAILAKESGYNIVTDPNV